jgi:NTP pyrophosphatase (non-canonical NTP hydrolase)
VWKIAEEKGWHESEQSFGDFISNCHAELSEAFEIYRKEGNFALTIVTPFEKMQHSAHHKVDMEFVVSIPTGIPVELADVIMRILDFCETCGIPLYQVLEMKMNFNKTREYRHGGKIV